MTSDRYEYLKGTENKGGIFNTDGRDNTGSWVAVTIATSKTYGTLKGAQRYMAKMGYTLV